MKLTLKAARVNADLTQREAGKLLGVTKDTIFNWENGRSFPSVKLIPEIERIYNVSYDDIIFCPKLRFKRNSREEH